MHEPMTTVIERTMGRIRRGWSDDETLHRRRCESSEHYRLRRYYDREPAHVIGIMRESGMPWHGVALALGVSVMTCLRWHKALPVGSATNTKG